jgi:hypothetical protein
MARLLWSRMFVCTRMVGQTWLAAAAGCGATSDSTSPAAADSGATAADSRAQGQTAAFSLPGADAEPPGVAVMSLRWQVVVRTPTVSASAEAGVAPVPSGPIAGVQVCVYQNSAIPCVTTQADGSFMMTRLPVRTNVLLTLKKAGYLPTVVPIETASTDTDGRGSPAYLAPAMGEDPGIGQAIDWQNAGQIAIFGINYSASGSLAGTGTTVTLGPPSGEGPYYLDGQQRLVSSATSFVNIGAAYYNVEPGTYTLTFAAQTLDCEPLMFPFGQAGFPITTPAHSVRFPVIAGYTTGLVGAICTPIPTIVAVPE